MKVAVCISGQMRNFESRLDLLRSNLLEKYDCDVFIHTWKERGVTTDINRLFPNGMTDYFQNDINNDSEEFIKEWSEVLPYLDSNNNIITKDYLKKAYPNVKSVVVEETPEGYEVNKALYGIQYPEFLLEKFPRRYHNLSMFYKIKACNDLKKEFELRNNFKYDFVIRIRPDLHLKSELDLTFHNQMVDNSIFCKSGMKADDYIFDQFFFGDSLSMDKISNIWDDLSWYWSKENNEFTNDEKRTIGYLLNHHCIINNIKIKQVDVQSTLLEDSKVDLTSFIPALERYININGMSRKISHAIFAAMTQSALHKFKSEGIAAMRDELDKTYIIAGYYFSKPLYGQALFYFENKDLDLSNQSFELALSLEPSNKKIIKSYAKLLFIQEEFDKLFSLLEDNNLQHELLFYKCRAKMHEDVINVYKNMNQDTELADNLKYSLSLSFYFLKKYEDALKILMEIQYSDSEKLRSNVNYKISQIYFYKKDKKKSLDYINTAIKYSVDPIGLIVFKSKILGNERESIACLTENVSFFYGKMYVFYYELYRYSVNNIDRAYYYIVKACETKPDYRDALEIKNTLDKRLALKYANLQY